MTPQEFHDTLIPILSRHIRRPFCLNFYLSNFKLYPCLVFGIKYFNDEAGSELKKFFCDLMENEDYLKISFYRGHIFFENNKWSEDSFKRLVHTFEQSWSEEVKNSILTSFFSVGNVEIQQANVFFDPNNNEMRQAVRRAMFFARNFFDVKNGGSMEEGDSGVITIREFDALVSAFDNAAAEKESKAAKTESAPPILT